MNSKKLTPDDSHAIESVILDATRIIASVLIRKGFRGESLADRLQASLTRLCSAVHSQQLRTHSEIISRARFCALDEVRTYCRKLRRERDAIRISSDVQLSTLSARAITED